MAYTETEGHEILDGDVALLTFVEFSEDSRRMFLIRIAIVQMAWNMSEQGINRAINRLKVLGEGGRRASSCWTGNVCASPTSWVNLPDFFVSYKVNIHLSRSSIEPRHRVDRAMRKSSKVTEPDARGSNVEKIRCA